MKLKINSIYVSLIFLAIMGFPIVATISQVANISSTPLAIVVRSIVFIISIAIIFYSANYIKVYYRYNVLIFFLFFWTMYFFRLIEVTFFSLDILDKSRGYYWVWAVSTCFIPFLAISIFRGYGINVYNNIFKLIFISLIFLNPLILIYGSTEVVSDIGEMNVDTGRFRLNSMNPISVGSMGALLSLFALWFFFDIKKCGLYKKTILIFGFLMGLNLLLLANSRGPIVAFVLVFLYILYRYLSIKIVFSCIVLIFSSFIFLDFKNFEYGGRIFSSSALSEAQEDSRFDIYKNSINIFLDNPLFGKNIIDPLTKMYPHNLFIEAFMSTGILGGTIFLLCVLILVYKVLRLTPNYLLGISILFLYNLIIAIFSGALYNSVYFWASCGLAISFLYSFYLGKNVYDKNSC